MASTPVEFKAPTGLTLTLSLYAFGSDTLANSGGADSGTERTNAKGIYTATVTEAVAGWCDAKILDGSGNLIATYVVFMVDDTNTHRCCELGDVYALSGTSQTARDIGASVNVGAVSGDSTAADTLELFAEALDQATGQLDSGSLASGTITAASIASDAITSAKIADNAIDAGAIATGAITSAKFAAGAIDAAAIATNAIDADALAADAVAEINATVDTALADYDGPTYTELLNFVRVICRKDSAIATDLLSVVTAINADIGSGSGAYASTTDAMEANRDNIGTAGAGLTEAGGTGDHLTAVPWNASWDAEVQSEVSDELTARGYSNTRAAYLDNINNSALQTTVAQTGDAYGALTGAQSEPGQGTPAANASPLTKIAYLFKNWRNRKTQTSSQWSLYNDDATTVDQKATVSDDGTTAGKTEIATGP